MRRCETCKHWSNPHKELIETYWGLPDEERGSSDKNLEAPGMWGVCELVAFGGPHNGSERFYVVDGSMYTASLNTRDDFGCVEHEPNESEQ